ncbi:hypothetical protein ACIQXI_04870 [Lysinibacillus sp. NPDC097195]|uniref:hypothetical protein n=1 Tax=Lysinibacillus sp. NPDC097195 TaxID=3364141 RepID=UPI00381E2DB6
MKFITKYGFFILPIIITLVGFFILKFSVDLGVGAASDYLDSIGGMDTAEFHSLQSKYILSNMLTGGILLSFGLIFLFFSFYRLSNNNK